MNSKFKNTLFIIGCVVAILTACWIGGLLEFHVLYSSWSAGSGFADPYLLVEWNEPWFSFNIPF